MKPRISNFNTMSTLVDRLCIENVKVAFFQNALEHDNPGPGEVEELRKKVSVQEGLIEALKGQLVELMEEVFLAGSYEYTTEERTFR